MNDNSGPAFPTVEIRDAAHVFRGMTLRDYFAGEALAKIDLELYGTGAGTREAYKIADAMLEAREQYAIAKATGEEV